MLPVDGKNQCLAVQVLFKWPLSLTCFFSFTLQAPEGDNQPSTEVDLFISTEKIMVLNTDLKVGRATFLRVRVELMNVCLVVISHKEIMMDHALRTISYIADIGDLLVLMARRRTPLDNGELDSGGGGDGLGDGHSSGGGDASVASDGGGHGSSASSLDNVQQQPQAPSSGSSGGSASSSSTALSSVKVRMPKMICHVFESEEAQYIAQSIGQAFQVAYMEFLKANGIEDSSFLKEMDYQEVLNSQEIFGNELEMFARKEKQKEVRVCILLSTRMNRFPLFIPSR